MRRKSIIILLVACVLASGGVLSSCGSMRSYWGVEGNYDFDDGYYHGKKYKKHKKHKNHKYYKNHRHHHDDDDDDDDD